MMRPFVSEDLNDYLAMSRIFYASDATDHPVPEEHLLRTFEETISESPLARGWMVRDNNSRLVGYMLASITWSNEFGGRVAWLEELYLKPEARGQGLGRRVIERAIDVLKENDKVAGFRLEVAPANEGVSYLYSQLGFARVPYDAWCMFL